MVVSGRVYQLTCLSSKQLESLLTASGCDVTDFGSLVRHGSMPVFNPCLIHLDFIPQRRPYISLQLHSQHFALSISLDRSCSQCFISPQMHILAGQMIFFFSNNLLLSSSIIWNLFRIQYHRPIFSRSLSRNYPSRPGSSTGLYDLSIPIPVYSMPRPATTVATEQ